MLSDAEERRLLEIEMMLLLERDPDFVRRFDARWTRPVRCRLPALVVLAAALALALVVIGVVVESLIAIVAGPAMLCVAVGVLVRHGAARRRDAAG